MTKKPRDLEPLVLEWPAEDKKLKTEIKGDSKTIVHWANGHAKLKTKRDTTCKRAEYPVGLVGSWRGSSTKGRRLGNSVPHSLLQYLKTRQITPLAKPTEGTDCFS